MNQIKRGGKREGAGRKSTGVVKTPITLYVEEKAIWPFGNKDKMKAKLYDYISSQTTPTAAIQDLTKPTVEIKPIEQPKTNYEAKVNPNPSIVPLGNFEALKAEILKTTTVREVEAVMKKVKTSLLPFGLKKQLEEIAKQHSKTMYND